MKKLLILIFFSFQIIYASYSQDSQWEGIFIGKGTSIFTPPSGGRGNDWILVLDDINKVFPAPGQ